MKNTLLLLLLFSGYVCAQDKPYNVQRITIENSWMVDPARFRTDYHVSVTSLEAPYPGGEAARHTLRERKEQSMQRFPRTTSMGSLYKGARDAGDSLTQLENFSARFFLTDFPMLGGTPNDNTLAISDGGMLLTSYNTQVWGYDLGADTFLFRNNAKHPSFGQFMSFYSDTAHALDFPFDPKLLYDPVRDRFILVFLTGRDPQNSGAIVAFSSTNYPTDVWHAYRLSGNPLNDSTWTDFPQIAINGNSLFLTLNQLYPDSSWITGFKQTVIWQMDLDAGFSGAAQLPAKLWSGVHHEGKKLRYLCPVKTGLGPESDTMYFVANRPFDIENDSFFLVTITGNALDTGGTMSVDLALSDIKYGLPPDAIQPNGHTFLTNDARALGAVRMQNEIQFVGNTVDPVSGKCAIFHGVIGDVNVPGVQGNIITHDTRDLGYPNIEFMGLSKADRETVIFFNHSSATDPAGNSAVYFDNSGNYGPIQTLVEGTNQVDRIPGTDERWGDYSGLQRKYNQTSRAWAAGYYSYGTTSNGIWISELAGPRDWSLGIDRTTLEKPETRTFPNPTTQYITLRFEMPEKAEALIELFDNSGRRVEVLAGDVVKQGLNELMFDIAPLASGIYVVRITSENRVILSEKIVKD